ncbi:hypothetical protein OAN61_00555 [bacterium]|nr:hypothetical protein [bacterium]
MVVFRYYSEAKGYVNAVPGKYHGAALTHRGQFFELVTAPLKLK